ncbi:TPA: Holliday junction resolvase RuvX [Candidatus Galligastranaerophilus intestinigallinarum]|nr:Holliday junction resolvase RuvX [Candidatus Galligastranaerophilus intestinigallinarum]
MEIKERVLALDVGDKRIGVAVSDPFFLFATGLKVIIRENDNKALEEIKEICQTYKIKKIVVGLPYNMDGTIGAQAKKTVKFTEKLENDFEIIYRDERLTYFEAEEMLKKENKKYTKNKGLVDIKAACIILQSYIGEQNG